MPNGLFFRGDRARPRRKAQHLPSIFTCAGPAHTTIAEANHANADCRRPQKHRHDRNGQMSFRQSEVRRVQIDDLVNRRQNYRHQWRVVLSGLDRRSPHPFVKAPYLGKQRFNLIASFATQQCDPVGGVLFQRSLHFAALRFGDGIGSQVGGYRVRSPPSQ